MSELKEVWSYKGHDGYQKIFRHYSQSLKSEHEFSIYLPPKALLNQKCPVMYWCTGAAADDREFVLKSGVQKYASERNMIVVAPEPRPGPLNDMPKEISAEYFVQFGFYVDATEPPYSETFRMHTYIMEELLPLIDYKFPVLTEKRGIAGHSMGGMASLVFGLRNTNIFQSISCMSPISNPTGMPIGQSLMKSYFGDKKDEEGPKYDPSLLIKNYEGPHRHILVDQGGKDELWSLCMTDSLIESVMMKNLSLTYRSHAGYSHGIETIASFIGDHIAHHADQMDWKG